MELLLDVVSVKPREDRTLELEFENHQRRLFDMKPYLGRKPFNRLRAYPDNPDRFWRAGGLFG
ncbi:MAG: DUF2442 domain-containing protein [Chitinivibrionales bacterium]|nr:DUF2442 domain-containing protein [Chitinivibrionales bacterium]